MKDLLLILTDLLTIAFTGNHTNVNELEQHGKDVAEFIRNETN